MCGVKIRVFKVKESIYVGLKVPNDAFLSSIEAEIITFLPKKAAIF